MKRFTLARSYLRDKTVGILTDGAITLATLENKWLDNQVNKSCIPEGCYLVKRDLLGRFKWYAIEDVKGRTGIEIHIGNTVRNTLGCILVGAYHDNSYNLAHSKDAMSRLLAHIGDNSFILNIRAATKDDL